MLKAPVWTWEVPTYFFVGGVAGVAGAIAGIAALAGADATLVRDARWIAAAGAAISPMLLISDLGRPERFLNMLRVIKLQSAMSVGVWTLVVFSVAIFGAIALWWIDAGTGGGALRGAGMLLDVIGIVSGLLLATYTGVLLGATAIPIWSRHAAILPVHFGASSLGAGASAVELLGHATPSLHVIAMAAAAAECAIMVRLWWTRAADDTARDHAGAGRWLAAGEMLAGPVALAVRIAGTWLPALRLVAAAAAIAGSALSRVGWIGLGREVPRSR